MQADVAVIGAGVFGAWTAWHLRRTGRSVLLLDAYGGGNSRASSGGESRIIRMGYGPREIYTRWSIRSMQLWREWIDSTDPTLFQRTEVLWIAAPGDTFAEDTASILERNGVHFFRIRHRDMVTSFPQFALEPDSWGILEPDSGALMARRAVQTLIRSGVEAGIRYEQERVTFDRGAVQTSSGENVSAGEYVFACGPWLPAIFPEHLGRRIRPSRQNILFFAAPDRRYAMPHMPCWIDINARYYGFPDLESRGFKVACDVHGALIDPDTEERTVPAEHVQQTRLYLARRFPELAAAPLLETRVCQYENTANGDYVLDRHPEYPNVWLVGGGSGHGFKHGPAVGEYVTAVMSGAAADERFSLASKPESDEGSTHSSFYRK